MTYQFLTVDPVENNQLILENETDPDGKPKPTRTNNGDPDSEDGDLEEEDGDEKDPNLEDLDDESGELDEGEEY
jgi:hypothetical protein